LDVTGVTNSHVRQRLGDWVAATTKAADVSYVDAYTKMGELLVSRPQEWKSLV